jgi:hypothetical protein
MSASIEDYQFKNIKIQLGRLEAVLRIQMYWIRKLWTDFLFFEFQIMAVLEETAKSNASTTAAKGEFKAPTAEEMSQLRETTELFKSNLFKLQVFLPF